VIPLTSNRRLGPLESPEDSGADTTERKHRRATLLTKYVLNPPMRALLRLGIPLPGTAILETIGRKSGRPRRTPVTDGLDANVFWIVTEHARRAAYVKNLVANPRVGIKVGRRWRSGTTRIAGDEDPHKRLEMIRRRRAADLNARIVLSMSTQLLVVRVDLDH
jgi:deazaflavin-dependent oxidoreductase (nitroreductase family)